MKRMIVYALTERETFDTALIKKGLEDVKEKGFDSIHFEWRNVSCSFTHPRMQKTIREFNRIARELGLKVSTHANPIYMNSLEIRNNMPELYTDPIEPIFSKLIDGNFKITTRDEKLHCNIEKCYLVERESEFCLSKCVDITDKIKEVSAIVHGGGCKMTKKTYLIDTITTYEVEGYTSGDIIAIIRYSYVYQGADLSNPMKRKCNSDILNTLSDLETDGFLWDEPHFGFAFCTNNGRQISENIYLQFKEKYNYDLKDNLISLWYNISGINSALVRLNYAEFLENALSDDEMDFYSKALKQLETKGIKGTIASHRTMHEETSDDFYIGCADYFRHNKATTGGFTDSVFEREDSMIAMFQLANSLSIDNEYKRAYNMSWGFNPTVEQNDYYVSLLAAMNISWNGHAYHGSIMFGPGYPNHPIWDRMKEDLEEHKNVLELLEDAIRINEIAILYTWKALATFPDNYIHTHRRNLLFLSKDLTLNNKQHQFISYEILEDANIEDGEIKTKVGNFKKLIIPWCNFISRKAFEKLKECKNKGIEVLIFGTPAFCFDDGSDGLEQFSKLCDINSIKVNSSVNFGDNLEIDGKSFAFNPKEIQENWDSNSDDSYPESYKYFSFNAKEKTAFINGQCVGSKNKSITYISAELPFYNKAIDFLFENHNGLKAIEDLIVFEFKTPNGKVLSGVSRWNKSLSGEFLWGDIKITLDNCKMFVVKIEDNVDPHIFATGKISIGETGK